MKNATILIFLFFTFFSCKHKKEFTINGVDYYTRKNCVKDSSWTEIGYRYGLSFRGRFEYSLGTINRSKCLEYKIDTLICK